MYISSRSVVAPAIMLTIIHLCESYSALARCAFSLDQNINIAPWVSRKILFKRQRSKIRSRSVNIYIDEKKTFCCRKSVLLSSESVLMSEIQIIVVFFFWEKLLARKLFDKNCKHVWLLTIAVVSIQKKTFMYRYWVISQVSKVFFFVKIEIEL